MNSCTRKKSYTKKDAQTVLNARMSRPRKKGQDELRIYPCGFCGGWHLTHT